MKRFLTLCTVLYLTAFTATAQKVVSPTGSPIVTGSRTGPSFSTVNSCPNGGNPVWIGTNDAGQYVIVVCQNTDGSFSFLGTTPNGTPVSILGSGTGSGTITSADGHLNCTITNGVAIGTCTYNYANSASVTVTAVAATGSTFTRYSGAGCSVSPCTFTVSAATSIIATFALNTSANLTIAGVGSGSGSVSTSDGKVSCVITASVTSGTCSASYAPGTSITLNASASGGSSFGQWGGTTCGTANSCVFNIQANTTVSAQFDTQSGAGPIAFVQASNNSGVFAGAQTAGNLNAAVVSWNDNSTTISAITDTSGNTYTLAKANTAAGSGTGWTQPVSAVKSGFAAGVTTRTCTMNVNAGQLAVIYSYGGTGATTMSIGDSGGNTWTARTAYYHTQVFYSVITNSSAGDVITTTWSASSSVGSICVVYASGTLPSQATILDTSANAIGSTQAMSVGNLTTTGTNDLIDVFCSDSTPSGSMTAGTDYTIISPVDTAFIAGAEDRRNLAAATYATPMTEPTSGTYGWVCTGVAWKGGAASGGQSQSIYYSPNIAAHAAGNTISVTWSGSAPAGIEITGIEYSGTATNCTPKGSGTMPTCVLDGTAQGGTGTSSAPASGSITTASVNSLLFCSTSTNGGVSVNPASGYTQRVYYSSSGDDVEDKYPVTAGSLGCSPTLSGSATWISQLAGFFGANQGGSVPTTYSLTITGSGTGNGKVTSNTGGINCTSSAGVTSGVCSASFPAGTIVSITANPQ